MKPGELISIWHPEVQKRLLNAIDYYEWKHSWHLPKTSYGIDWGNRKTVDKCLEVLRDYRRNAMRFAIECETLCGVLERHLAERQLDGGES